MDRFIVYLIGFLLGIWRGYGFFHFSSYEKGYECGVIVSKMDILTDNGTGEYKRLSDKYDLLKCYYDNEDEDIHSYIQNM